MLKRMIEKYKSFPMAIRASIIYLFCSVLQKGVSFIVVPIYTRMVPSEDYGIYSLYQSYETVLCIFCTLNMWNYLYIKGMIKYEKEKDRFTSGLIGLCLLLTSVILVVILVFDDLIVELTGLPIIVFWLMIIEFYFRPSFEFWCSRQRFDFRVKKYGIVSIIIAILTPVFTISSIIVEKKIRLIDLGTTLVFGKIAVPVAFYIIIFCLLIKKFKNIIQFDIWKHALKFSLPLIPHYLSVVILAQSDRIMIGKMCGKSEAAMYGVAYSTAAVLLIVNTAMMDSIIPWTYKKIKAGDTNKVNIVCSTSIILIVALNTLLAVFSPEVIRIMAPEEYSIAAYIIPPVAISNVFIFMFNLFANIEYYFEETKFVSYSSIISAFLNVLLNYIFIKQYGFIAAGYTTLVCYVIYALSHFCFMNYVMKKHNYFERLYDTKKIWLIGISAAVLSIIIIMIFNYLIIRIVVFGTVIFVVYVFRNRIKELIMTVKNEK